MKGPIVVFLKGVGMGAANVIPGVSGGTVAFITGIYERLINAIKSFDVTAAKLLLKGQFRAFAEKVDFWFLSCLGGGVIVSILTLAKVLEYLFASHATYVYAFFFGLILASIFFVGRQVKRWSASPLTCCLVGAGIAVTVALMKPASQNDSVSYLLICGVVAMASMIIPGLSGSFVLLLMGNYQLIMIESVSRLTGGDLAVLTVLIPVGIGAVIGVVALSHLLAWIFQRYHDQAVALLTGFVAGSLLIIWPWKEEIVQTFEVAGKAKDKVIGYEWFLPDLSVGTGLAIGIMVLGFVIVWVMESLGKEAIAAEKVEAASEAEKT